MRDLRIVPVADKGVLDQPMTLISSDVKAPGGSRRNAARCCVVEHTADTSLGDVPFQKSAREDAGAPRKISRSTGSRFPAPGPSSCPTAIRAPLEAMLRDLGLSARAVAAAPRSRRTSSIFRASATSTAGPGRRTKAGGARRSTPTASRTRSFADQKLREGRLRAK